MALNKDSLKEDIIVSLKSGAVTTGIPETVFEDIPFTLEAVVDNTIDHILSNLEVIIPVGAIQIITETGVKLNTNIITITGTGQIK